MDEENKPFPIELLVILLVVAIGNDAAQVFCILLDFTGVGIAGEAIMEPINFVLDFFFTGIFVWKCGLGGGTISQYINDLLQLCFIPGRTISVFLGMRIANNPSSIVGKVAATASSLESGNIEGAIEGETKNVTQQAEKEMPAGGKSLEGEAGGGRGASSEQEEKIGKNGSSGNEGENNKGEDISQSPAERDPMENLQQNLEEPDNVVSISSGPKAKPNSYESDAKEGKKLRKAA